MSQAISNQHAISPIFRLDTPEALDIQAIEASIAQPQRNAWRYLASIVDVAGKRHCHQFCIEPDATLWRVRYRTVDSFDEHIVPDPSQLNWALGALQTQLWGENYHQEAKRTKRFMWKQNGFNLAVTLRVVQTVNGDLFEFDTDLMRPMPPLLEEIGLQAEQLRDLRARLQQSNGMILITSSQPSALDDILLAINQDLINPERKLMSLHDQHRYSLPRTIQIDIPAHSEQASGRSWQEALVTYHDTLMISTSVPEQFHEQIANNCDQGVLAIHVQRVARAADSIDLLNSSVIRRVPLHRSVNTVLNHYPVRSICSTCAEQAVLNDEENDWLQQLRTPASENVIGWLTDGNTDQFMTASGCDACAQSGEGVPLSVFDIIHRDKLNHQFPATGKSAAVGEQTSALQRQLMSLAKAGRITLAEVLRVLGQSA